LGRITKRGDVYLRTLLVHGARAALITMARRTDRLALWAHALIARRGFKKACVALAAKNARTIWARSATGTRERRSRALRLMRLFGSCRQRTTVSTLSIAYQACMLALTRTAFR